MRKRPEIEFVCAAAAAWILTCVIGTHLNVGLGEQHLLPSLLMLDVLFLFTVNGLFCTNHQCYHRHIQITHIPHIIPPLTNLEPSLRSILSSLSKHPTICPAIISTITELNSISRYEVN